MNKNATGAISQTKGKNIVKVWKNMEIFVAPRKTKVHSCVIEEFHLGYLKKIMTNKSYITKKQQRRRMNHHVNEIKTPIKRKLFIFNYCVFMCQRIADIVSRISASQALKIPADIG